MLLWSWLAPKFISVIVWDPMSILGRGCCLRRLKGSVMTRSRCLEMHPDTICFLL
jgi:hypothetical protein